MLLVAPLAAARAPGTGRVTTDAAEARVAREEEVTESCLVNLSSLGAVIPAAPHVLYEVRPANEAAAVVGPAADALQQNTPHTERDNPTLISE